MNKNIYITIVAIFLLILITVPQTEAQSSSSNPFSDFFGNIMRFFLPQARDVTPPSVVISQSPSQSAFGETVTIAATASDNARVLAVRIFVDGSNVITCPTGTCGYSTSNIAAGNHLFYVTATDASGNTAQTATSSFYISPGAAQAVSKPTAQPAGAQGTTATLSCGQALVSGTTYVLNSDISSAGNCITINGQSNIIIDGKDPSTGENHRITSTGGNGIYITGGHAYNIEIRNLKINAALDGVFLTGSSASSTCGSAVAEEVRIVDNVFENGGISGPGGGNARAFCNIAARNNRIMNGGIGLVNYFNLPNFTIVNNEILDGTIGLSKFDNAVIKDNKVTATSPVYEIANFDRLTGSLIRGNSFVVKGSQDLSQQYFIEINQLMNSVMDSNYIENSNAGPLGRIITMIIFTTKNTNFTNNIIIEDQLNPPSNQQGVIKFRAMGHDEPDNIGNENDTWYNNTVIAKDAGATAFYMIFGTDELQPRNTFDSNTFISTTEIGFHGIVGPDNVMRNNIIIGNPAADLTECQGTLSFYNNIIIGESGSAMTLGSTCTVNANVRNTILYSPSFTPVTGSISGAYNLFYPTYSSPTPSSINGQNPNFVNPSGAILDANNNLARNYHLQSGSPAIDAGDTTIQVPLDKDGVSRPQGARQDIGAYESGGGVPAGPPNCTDTDSSTYPTINADVNGTVSIRGDLTSYPDTCQGAFSLKEAYCQSVGSNAPSYSTITCTDGCRTVFSEARCNKKPAAVLNANPTSGTVPLTVSFSASGSSDPDGDPLTYSWNYGDSQTGSGLSTSHTYTSAGTYTATLTVTDGYGGSDTKTATISAGVQDTTPPVISNVQASSITDTSAMITWATNEPSSSVVNYGTSSGYYPSTATGAGGVTSHSVQLSGLSSGTAYFYRVTSADTSGNSAQSAEQTFTTLAPQTSCGIACNGCTTNRILGTACSPSNRLCDGTNSVEDISLSSAQIAAGSPLAVTINYACYSAADHPVSTDSLALWYYNGASWRRLQTWGNGNADGNPATLSGCDNLADGADGSVTFTFTPDSVVGTHYVRAVEADGLFAGSNQCPSSASQWWGNIDDMPFTVNANQAPNGIINTPTGAVTIIAGHSVSFSGTGTDPDNTLPLVYAWNFGGGAPDQYVEDPGPVYFNTPGTYAVTFTATDDLGLPDPTPDTRVITVNPAYSIQFVTPTPQNGKTIYTTNIEIKAATNDPYPFSDFTLNFDSVPYKLPNLLSCHFENSYACDQGKTATTTGTTFATGKFERGILVDGSDRLYYPSSNNINTNEGTVMFWITPNTNWLTASGYVLLDTYNDAAGTGLFAWKASGADSIKIVRYAGTNISVITVPSAPFVQGGLSHFAVAYGSGKLDMYVNGNIVKSVDYSGTITAFNESIFLGQRRYPVGGNLFQANAVFDEFKIYGKRLTGTEINNIYNKESGSYYIKFVRLQVPRISLHTFNASATDSNNNHIASETVSFTICTKRPCNTGVQPSVTEAGLPEKIADYISSFFDNLAEKLI